MKNLFKALGKMKMKDLVHRGGVDKPLLFIVSIALFIAANILIQPLSLKADLSKGKAYTLSPATVRLLKSLDDVLTVNFYASENLPSRLVPLKTEVNDLLNEYKKESGNKVVIKTVDPKNDQNARKDTEELGIPELQFSQLESDKYQLTTAYFGMGLSYGGKKESLPQATDLSNLEYNITSLIYRLVKKEPEQVAVIGALPAQDPQSDPYGVLTQVLATQYEVSPLDITDPEVKTIDPSYRFVIFIASNEKTEDAVIEKVRQYLRSGGKVLFLVDGVHVNDDLSASPAGHNLFALLKETGITLNTDFVLSTSAEFVNFGNASYQFYTPYPFWVKTNSFKKDTGYFANVPSLTFPWTSSVTVDPKKGETLVYAPKTSWKQTADYTLIPQSIKEPAAGSMKEYPLIASAKTGKNGMAVVVPSSRFLDARYLGRGAGNIEWAFNLVNGLASGGALSGIRSRSLNIYPVPDLPTNQKDLVKYGNMILLPALFAAYGAWRLMRRR